MFQRLFAALFAAITFASLLAPANAVVINNKGTYIGTPALVAALPVNYKYAILADFTNEEYYSGSVFYHKLILMTEDSLMLDPAFRGFDVCPRYFPDGVTELYIDGYSLFTWIIVQPKADPFPGVPDTLILQCCQIRGLIVHQDSGQQSQQLVQSPVLKTETLGTTKKALMGSGTKTQSALEIWNSRFKPAIKK